MGACSSCIRGRDEVVVKSSQLEPRGKVSEPSRDISTSTQPAQEPQAKRPVEHIYVQAVDLQPSSTAEPSADSPNLVETTSQTVSVDTIQLITTSPQTDHVVATGRISAPAPAVLPTIVSSQPVPSLSADQQSASTSTAAANPAPPTPTISQLPAVSATTGQTLAEPALESSEADQTALLTSAQAASPTPPAVAPKFHQYPIVYSPRDRVANAASAATHSSIARQAEVTKDRPSPLESKRNKATIPACQTGASPASATSTSATPAHILALSSFLPAPKMPAAPLRAVDGAAAAAEVAGGQSASPKGGKKAAKRKVSKKSASGRKQY